MVFHGMCVSLTRVQDFLAVDILCRVIPHVCALEDV